MLLNCEVINTILKIAVFRHEKVFEEFLVDAQYFLLFLLHLLEILRVGETHCKVEEFHVVTLVVGRGIRELLLLGNPLSKVVEVFVEGEVRVHLLFRRVQLPRDVLVQYLSAKEAIVDEQEKSFHNNLFN